MLVKVNKRQARKLYNAGVAIKIVPHKVNPQNMWYKSGGWYDNTEKRDFDKLVDEYEYYNCYSPSLGRYCAYYIKEVPV